MLIVFDLDGTLIDSRLDLAESANEMLATYAAGPLTVDEVVAMVGEGARVLVERVLAGAGVGADGSEALERFLAIYDRRLLMHTRPYPGIVDAILALAPRASLAVLTNKPERPTRRLLEAFALAPHFRWVIGGDSGFPRKPDPTGLIHLATAAGTPLRATLFVGDSMVDVETARRAGVRACVALYGFGQSRNDMSLLGNELLADDPSDIYPLVSAFLESRQRKPPRRL